MTRNQIIEWLVAQGFTQSKLSNEIYLNRNMPFSRYRVTKMGVKFERRLPQERTWFRALSGRYKDLSLDKRGLLMGLTTKGM